MSIGSCARVCIDITPPPTNVGGKYIFFGSKGRMSFHFSVAIAILKESQFPKNNNFSLVQRHKWSPGEDLDSKHRLLVRKARMPANRNSVMSFISYYNFKLLINKQSVQKSNSFFWVLVGAILIEKIPEFIDGKDCLCPQSHRLAPEIFDHYQMINDPLPFVKRRRCYWSLFEVH